MPTPEQALTPPTQLAVYVHWPFCLSKCPYCDFNSHVAAAAIDQSAWCRALLSELDHNADLLPGRMISSVFFGGGTPSLMPPATVAALLNRIAARWSLSEHVEITLETNPTSAETTVLADMAAAGVNRVSLGVQALDDAALRFLGRQHDTAAALDVVSRAAQLFSRYSFDLIYARPDQCVAAWRAELSRALRYTRDHLSVYQLTIEKGTPFYAAARQGAFAMPSEDLQAALFEETQSILDAAGMPAYEISNHARAGAESRHNLACWRYNDYAGIGPGAHGRITVGGALWATETHPAPARWLGAVQRCGHGQRRCQRLDSTARRDEMLLMGLRLTDGIPRHAFLQRLGKPPEEVLDSRRVAALTAAGLVTLDSEGLRVTTAGRHCLDSVVAHLTA